MNEPIQLSPSLAIYDDDGELTIRTSDQGQWKLITPQVLKAIGDSLHPRKVTLVTPTDTKVFKFGQNGKEAGNGRLHNDSATKDTGRGNEAGSSATSTSSGEDSGRRPQEPLPRPSARIQQDHSAPPAPEIVADAQDEFEQELRRQQLEQVEIEKAQREDQASAPDAQPRVKSRERPQPEARTETACGRCYGQGKLDGGGICPVCRGKGSIAKWGRGRK